MRVKPKPILRLTGIYGSSTPAYLPPADHPLRLCKVSSIDPEFPTYWWETVRDGRTYWWQLRTEKQMESDRPAQCSV